ncbi:hypothetical protein D3C86_880550 [compost metagenome]
MTDQNNAAQAATQSVLTDEDRRLLLVRANYPQIQADKDGDGRQQEANDER